MDSVALQEEEILLLDKQPLRFQQQSIYLSEIEALKQRRGFYHDLTLGYVVPRWKSLEIDELPDLICAEALLKARQEGCF